MDKTITYWENDAFVPITETKANLLTHSLHYGVGVFEGIRSYQTPDGPLIFRLPEHTKRLLKSAQILGMTVPYSFDKLLEMQIAIIKHNQFGDAYLRPLVYYDGDGYIGLHTKNLKTQVAIIAFPWKNYLSDQQYQNGIRLITSSLTRYHPNSIYSRAKSTGKYLSTVMALQQASLAHADDAIFLDQQGFVAEGTGTNIFLVQDETIYSAASATALEGITRSTIIQIAQDLGLTVIEKNLLRDDLYTADEVFFTGTAAQIVGINQIDGRQINQGKVGPITQLLMTHYADCVRGKLEKYNHWISRVK